MASRMAGMRSFLNDQSGVVLPEGNLVNSAGMLVRQLIITSHLFACFLLCRGGLLHIPFALAGRVTATKARPAVDFRRLKLPTSLFGFAHPIQLSWQDDSFWPFLPVATLSHFEADLGRTKLPVTERLKSNNN